MKTREINTTGEMGRATPGESAVGSGTRDTYIVDEKSKLRDWKDISTWSERNSVDNPQSDPGINPSMAYGSSPFVVLVIFAIGYMVIK